MLSFGGSAGFSALLLLTALVSPQEYLPLIFFLVGAFLGQLLDQKGGGAVKKVFEGVCEFDKEDGKQAWIATISDEIGPNGPMPDSQMFVRIQSWDEKGDYENERSVIDQSHSDARKFSGKKVRVTVEVID